MHMCSVVKVTAVAVAVAVAMLMLMLSCSCSCSCALDVAKVDALSGNVVRRQTTAIAIVPAPAVVLPQHDCFGQLRCEQGPSSRSKQIDRDGVCCGRSWWCGRWSARDSARRGS